MLQLSVHAWNHYYTINTVSSSGVVVTCTFERIVVLGLPASEININFEINIKKVKKQENKKNIKVKRCRDGMPKSMQTR